MAAAEVAAPLHCKSTSYAYCCGFGVPCDCRQGMTAAGQCSQTSYAFCCGVGTPCICCESPVNISTRTCLCRRVTSCSCRERLHLLSASGVPLCVVATLVSLAHAARGPLPLASQNLKTHPGSSSSDLRLGLACPICLAADDDRMQADSLKKEILGAGCRRKGISCKQNDHHELE